MSLRRWITIIALSALIIAAIIYGFVPKPVDVELAKAAKAPLMVTIEEEGETRVKDRFIISAPVAGYMRRVELEAGERVKDGQVVGMIEPIRANPLDPRSRAEAEASLSAAREALNSARENARSREAEADLALKELDRAKKLFSEGHISKGILDQAESDARKREADLLSAKAAVKAASFELERARAVLYHPAVEKGVKVDVNSPVSGRVLKIHKESAGVVNAGDEIMDVGDPERLEVKVELLSSDAVKVKPGTPVVFERWGGDAPLMGKVRTIEPAGFTKVSSLGVEEQRVLVIVEIASEPEKWKHLGDGYSLEAKFILWEGKDVLQAPAGALFRYKDGWAVFVREKNRARLRQVEVGHTNGLASEIISGLSEGESVIIHPDESLKDGSRVKVR